MNNKNTKLLYERFPDLYRGHKKSIRDSAMPWGFQHGDGWFDIIWKLSEQLEALGEDIEVSTVKEKYGGLSFYIWGGGEKAFALTGQACKQSYLTCEDCGRPGKPNESGYIMTLCDECRGEEGNGN